jgi:hypothetical protein
MVQNIHLKNKPSECKGIFLPLVISNFGWSDQATYQATPEACGHEFKPYGRLAAQVTL